LEQRKGMLRLQEGQRVPGLKGEGEARKRQSLLFTASFMSPPRQCEGYNARVVSLCFSKGCVYTVQTPGENPTLYTGEGIQRPGTGKKHRRGNLGWEDGS
jgi:hypothetical protein